VTRAEYRRVILGIRGDAVEAMRCRRSRYGRCDRDRFSPMEAGIRSWFERVPRRRRGAAETRSTVRSPNSGMVQQGLGLTVAWFDSDLVSHRLWGDPPSGVSAYSAVGTAELPFFRLQTARQPRARCELLDRRSEFPVGPSDAILHCFNATGSTTANAPSPTTVLLFWWITLGGFIVFLGFVVSSEHDRKSGTGFPKRSCSNKEIRYDAARRRSTGRLFGRGQRVWRFRNFPLFISRRFS